MKKAVVSLAAVLMVLASLATPSFAGNNSNEFNGQTMRFSLSTGTPVVQAGTTIAVTGTVTMLTDANTARRNITYVVAIPDLRQSRSGVRSMATGRTRSLTKTFQIPDRIEPGDYTITFGVDNGQERGIASLTFTVTK